MNKTLAARIRASRIASSTVLLLSFAVPFLWALSTGVIYDLGSDVTAATSDTAIMFNPLGIVFAALVMAVWLIGFAVAWRRLGPKPRIVALANTLAVAAVCVCFTWQLGAGVWNPRPMPELTNLFPFRIAIAVLLAYACSIWAARHVLPRPDHSNKP